MTIRIACIGGGPGGLFFATLAKRWLPDSEVVVYERNRADDAFGFGVVFSDATLRRIDEADPVLSDGLARYGVHWDALSVWLKGAKTSFAGNGMAAIDRKVLLRLLQERAREAGADLRFGQQAPDLADLADVDLVVAADGANSPTRAAYGADLGHTTEVAAAKFIWLGTRHLFDGLTFIHRKSEHGTFAAHTYPINDQLSTFTVETDEATWRAAGLDEFDVRQSPGPSDEKTRRYLQDLFAEDLDGAEVVGNNSRWANFTTRSTRSWHRGNVVWLGDAVHTAHFSVGSGTKMAMEDAVALARQVAEHPGDLTLAVKGYEAERQPKVATVQQLARPSLSWWENFGRYYDAFDPQQFTFHFASRSIDVEKVRQRDAALVDGVERAWLGEHGAPPLSTPFAVGDVRLAGRLLRLQDGPDGPVLTDGHGTRVPVTADPAHASPSVGLVVEAPEAESDLPASSVALDTTAPVIVVRGGTDLTRVLLAEQARLAHGRPTVIAQDDPGPALTLILSGRTDALAVTSPTQHTSSGVVRWPDETARHYREAGYWKDRPLGAYFMATADRVPDRIALVDGPVRFTYAELADRVDAAALRLLDLGLRTDDRILVQMPNTWQFVVLTLACLRAGIIPLMALPAHRQNELVHFAHHAECVAIAVPDVVKDHDFQAMAGELAALSPSIRHVLVCGAAAPGNVDLDALLAPSSPESGPDAAQARRLMDAAAPDPDSPACFLLSGGTTGLPKLITRTHNDYAYNVQVTSANTAVDDATVYLVTLPAGHNFPLGCPGILGTLFAGGRVVMLRSSEPAKAFDAIEAEGVTLTSAVPAIAHRWVEHARATGPTGTGGAGGTGKLASLEVIQVGGSRLADEIAYSITPVLGARLQQTFGMAEGLVNATRLDDPDDVICTTQGRPVSPGDEIRLVDEDGRDVPDGTPGSFLARGPYTPRGYYRAPEHNQRAFTDGGWYSSGDIVVRRADGNLVVLGRDKDMINRGGEKISAEEVEGLVYRLGSVALAAAVSMPDPVLGERVCVYATVHAGASVTLADVQRSVREAGVAAFKVPEHLVVVEEMPLTRIGKIDKARLRADITERLAATPT